MYNSFPVINITLPDEKSNYVHRIGRVGRADRMGLAISLVATVPEKVGRFIYVKYLCISVCVCVCMCRNISYIITY